MPETRQTFSKEERLKSVKAIASLFSEGQSEFVYPLKIIWKVTDSASNRPIKAAFSVSAKIFRKSTTRNLIKRKMREAFRLTKVNFSGAWGEKKIIVMFIYIAREEIDFSRIQKSMIFGMKKITGKLLPVSPE